MIRKSLLTIVIFGCVLVFQSGFASEPKLAQTGFQFLSVPADARSAAMGEAFTAMHNYSSSIFHNPAFAAQMNTFFDGSLHLNKWIADIDHTSGSLSINPWQGRFGVFTVSLLMVDYGEFLATAVDQTVEIGYRDIGTFSPSAYSFGLGYSKFLSDRFAFGVHAKYVSQDLGSSLVDDPSSPTLARTKNYSLGAMAFDFGTIYKTGLRSLVFGMSVRNFSEEIKYETEGFQLPLNFRIGLAMDLIDVIPMDDEMHKLMLSVDATHPRAAPEQLKVGAEYTLMKTVSFRFGYTGNVDERSISAGVGIQTQLGEQGLALDYAYTPFGVFDNVQRFSFRISL